MSKKLDRREFIKNMSYLGIGLPLVLSGCDSGNKGQEAVKRRLKGQGFDKVIVLGIDGLDPKIIEALMEKGELPNFSRLRASGSYALLATSNPPQSPTAWSTLATGSNPGFHGIFDFIKRDPESYLPDLSILKSNPKRIIPGNPMFLPVMKGKPFWEIVSEEGIPSTVVKWPITFPPAEGEGRLIAGLGVPDIKGSMGNYKFYTTRTVPENEEGREKVVKVTNENSSISTIIHGPMVSKLGVQQPSEIDMNIKIAPDKLSATIHIGNSSFNIKKGEWSKWVRLKFNISFMTNVYGICKFYLTNVSPEFELYLSPIQIDPKEPCFPISNPDEYAAEMADKTDGTFYTLGLPEDTKALTENRFQEDAFLQMCDDIISEQEKMLWFELERFKDGLLSYAFLTTDRIQHMFWHSRDMEHPLYSSSFENEYGHVIPDYYRRMDGVLGRVMEYVDKKTAIYVVSDHGFSTYRRTVHLNSLLVDNGIMSLNENVPKDDPEGGPLFQYVDWERTKAYALGFGSIFLNIKGREGNGTVGRGSEAKRVAREVAEKIKQLRDPDTGARMVKNVYLKEDIYRGPYMNDAPDLVIGFYPGYRMSWQTAIGGCPNKLVEDNKKKWSGDHCIDPGFVPGVFFSNQKIKAVNPSLIDIAPTVLASFKIAKPGNMEGSSLI
jgi:predicted AlkP superfamily phosphohydrolase/phosphomutase